MIFFLRAKDAIEIPKDFLEVIEPGEFILCSDFFIYVGF